MSDLDSASKNTSKTHIDIMEKDYILIKIIFFNSKFLTQAVIHVLPQRTATPIYWRTP